MENTIFNISLLFVEDEKETREGISEMIGWRVKHFYVAKNAKEALDIYKINKPELVLSDIKMPGMDGLEMADKMKQINPQLRIIMMSAFTDTNYLLRSIDLQVDGYIVKPVRKQKIFSAIKKQADIIISEKKIKEQEIALNESLGKLKLLFNKNSDSITLCELTETGPSKFIAFNDATCINSEYTNDELYDLSPLDINTKESFDKTISMLPILFKEKKITYTGNILTKTKKIKPVEIVVHMFEVNGKSMLLSVSRDISERDKAEQKLKKSEEKYRLIAENVSDVIWIMNLNNEKFTYISPSIYQMRGYSVEEAMQQSIQQSLTPESVIGAMNEIQVGIKEFIANPEKGRLFRAEVQQPCKNGDLIWVEMILSYRFNSIGEIEVVGISRNIEEQKKTDSKIQKQNKQLKELNLTKDKFFSIIAHDLKSPFSSLLGFSELLINNFERYDIQKQKKFLNILNQDLQKTYKLLENLLLWSQSQRQTIEFKPQKENLKLLAENAISILKQGAENKSITLLNKIDDVFIDADKNMFSAIIRNLISNAIKFTHKGGKITVSANNITNNNNEKFIEISVIDNGVGIAEENISKLFTISEKDTKKGTENEEGSGIGLIICKEFIEKHNGSIYVKSKINKGSEFIFTIPYNT